MLRSEKAISASVGAENSLMYRLWPLFHALVAVTPVCSATSAAAPAEISSADGPKSAFWAKRETGYFSASDGTQLRYSVLLPAKSGRFPVALIYSGYDTGSIGGTSDLANDVTFSVELEQTLVEKGYAVLGVNTRATGCSEGNHFTFLGSTYGQDGRDAVEFAASQRWSTGSVGMFGWSWSGMSQLATASNRPPHLKAIAPGMVLGDQRLDNSYPGGVTEYSLANDWRVFLRGRWKAVKKSAEAEHDTRCIEQLQRNLKTEQDDSWARELLRHPLRDAWTEEQRLSRRTSEIAVPVLSMESFQDDATTSREGYYHETLDPNKTWMLQTTGGHDLYESLEFRKILVAFLDRFVKGASNAFDSRPHLTVWLDTRSNGPGMHGRMKAAVPGWQFSSEALFPSVSPVAFSIMDRARLVRDGEGSGGPDAYDYPTPGPAVDIDFSNDAWGVLPANWRKGSLAYTSPPLDRDILVYGPASADLWLSAKVPDLDLQVTLSEVRPDGQEMFLQRSWLRVSDRAIDVSRSTEVRPVLIDQPETLQLLNPDEPALARVEINKFAAALRKGSRLRLWIDTPSPTGDYTFSYLTWPDTIHIWHDAQHPSRLVLGELHNVSIPPNDAPCSSALKEPCRTDPLAEPVR